MTRFHMIFRGALDQQPLFPSKVCSHTLLQACQLAPGISDHRGRSRGWRRLFRVPSQLRFDNNSAEAFNEYKAKTIINNSWLSFPEVNGFLSACPAGKHSRGVRQTKPMILLFCPSPFFSFTCSPFLLPQDILQIWGTCPI